jgi:hypothetical protein
MAQHLKIVAGTTATADPYELMLNQHDPAFRAIDAHRQAVKILTKAVDLECASEGKVTEAALERLGETTAEAWDDIDATSRALVKTQPTTMLGAIALLQYLATQFGDDSRVDTTTMPSGTGREAWPAAIFRSLAAALVQVRP